MRVLIDAVAPGERPRGVGRYITRLANALANDRDLSISLALGPWQMREYETLIVGDVELLTVHPTSDTRIGRHLWHQFALGRLARRVGADLIHLPDTLPTPMLATPIVATIHDLAEFDLPEAYGRVQRRYRQRMATRAAERAAGLITVSEFSRQRIETLFPQVAGRVSVIPNGPGITPLVEQVEPRIAISPSFFLFVGGLNRNKNLSRVVDAFTTLGEPGVDLVIAGPAGNDVATVGAACARTDNIKWLEGGSDAELAWLYHRAQALVMPSLYEGFGLPILEAMSFGTPVIASRSGAPAEVVGDAGLLVDPLEAESIRHAMARVLADPQFRRRLSLSSRNRAGSYSWEAAALATARLYRTVNASATSRSGA